MSFIKNITKRTKAAPKKDLLLAGVCLLLCVGLLIYFVTLFI